jgi:cell division protein FtsB
LRAPRRIVWWIGGAVVAFLVFGNQGFRQLTQTFREKRRLEKTLTALRSEQERLTRELNWIQRDPSYTEYLIRKNLGYVKQGEVEYRLIKREKQAAKPR